jgi:hypothetical protein
MPRIWDTRALDLPQGGLWYDDRDEAVAKVNAYGGHMVEIALSSRDTGDWGNMYGVYPTQEEFCKQAKAFLKTLRRNPDEEQPVTTASIQAMLRVHTPIHTKECGLYHLPDEGKWFYNEMGALTAYTLLKTQTAYFVKLFFLFDTPDDYTHDALEATSHMPLYGVFRNTSDWNKHRRSLPRNIYEPTYPFRITSAAKYDRCRCTLMQVEGALYKEPQVQFIPDKEMREFATKKGISLPWNDFKWTRTKEEALKLGGHTLKWVIDKKDEFYSAHGDFKLCNKHLRAFVETMISMEPNYPYKQAETLIRVKWFPVSSSAMYGYMEEDYNYTESMIGLARALTQQDDSE